MCLRVRLTNRPSMSPGARLSAVCTRAPVRLLSFQAMRADFVAGVCTEAYRLVAGNMGQTLLNGKDADGNSIPIEVVREASMVYGMISSGLEAASEMLFLELARPLGMPAHAIKEGGEGILRGAIVRAARDRSVCYVLMNLAVRPGANMVQEGAAIATKSPRGPA